MDAAAASVRSTFLIDHAIVAPSNVGLRQASPESAGSRRIEPAADRREGALNAVCGASGEFGNPAVVGPEPLRPETLRPRLSVGLAFSMRSADAGRMPWRGQVEF